MVVKSILDSRSMNKPERRPRISREQQKALRFEELTNAAWTLFCEKGYESLTIDEVAEYAGYSRMPIYSLFGDKQNLFFHVWKKISLELMGILLKGCKEGATLNQNLRQLAENLLQDQANKDSHGASIFYVVQSIGISRPDIQEKLRDLAEIHLQGIKAMISYSVLEPGQTLRSDPEIIALNLIAMINGSSTVEFQTRRHFQDADYLHTLYKAMALE